MIGSYLHIDRPSGNTYDRYDITVILMEIAINSKLKFNGETSKASRQCGCCHYWYSRFVTNKTALENIWYFKDNWFSYPYKDIVLLILAALGSAQKHPLFQHKSQN